MDKQIEQLYQALEDSSFTVAITGAGISISAGGVSYAGMGARGGFNMRSGNPDEMYKGLYRVFMEPAFQHGPTVAHKALARLEEMGKLQGIITTNEDCIHTMAGSKNVAELEGSFQINTCENCGYRNYDYEIWNQGHMPVCPECGGRMLPYNIYSHIGLWEPAVKDAQDWMRQADLILIIGTSGYFGSVYWDCKKKDARIFQINPKRTHFDSIAEVSIHEDADTAFGELMKLEEEAQKMSEQISIINQTLELSEVKNHWKFDETYQCWALQDVLYTLKATTPAYQRLSIFVPAPYMKEGGVINPDGRMNGYTAKNAPVVLNNNSAGYRQMPHLYLGDRRCKGTQYLERGFVYVTCGNRGNESEDQNGNYVGKIPSNLVDLKTVIRFLRHNAAELPGDLEKIISVGWSAGGAMSTLLAVTGNSKNYDPYLEENGAFMDERDDVYASQIYCPIIDLEHADLAYEWMFSADKENEDSPAGPHSIMTPFQEALSKKLSEAYIHYFNEMGLKDPDTGAALVLGEDGRSGSAYEYLMNILNESATKYFSGGGEAPFTTSWITWDGKHAVVADLDSYVLNHRRRMKPCTSFDVLPCTSGENRVYGRPEEPTVHFNTQIAEAIASLKDAFPEEYEKYYPAYKDVAKDAYLTKQKHLNNPMEYIGTEEKADRAAYYRIRVGSIDADTSFIISMALAVKLANTGAQTDYAIVWDQPHSEADYPGEVCEWIESITR